MLFASFLRVDFLIGISLGKLKWLIRPLGVDGVRGMSETKLFFLNPDVSPAMSLCLGISSNDNGDVSVGSSRPPKMFKFIFLLVRLFPF